MKVSEAEAAYSVAQADPVVSKDGQLQLYEAKQDLDRAHHALKNGDDTEIVEHYAYLAQRRVEIARANADREEARKRSQALGAERDAAVLDERTREADRAHESAALANERAAIAELDAQSVRAELSDLQARDTARGLVITLPNDVLFDVDRAELKPGALHELSRVAELLQRDPHRNVRVEGHADSTGSQLHNLDLSKLRAESVGNALIEDGVSPSRVTTEGYGDSMPIAGNDTAAGRQQNRRVEIIVQSAPSVPLPR